MMKILFWICCCWTSFTFAQNAHEVHDRFSKEFLAQLSQKTDTVLHYYRTSEERTPKVIAHFLWKENGNTLHYNYERAKTDTITTDAKPLWDDLFTNYTAMKKEKPKPFAYLKNPKKPKSAIPLYEIGLESEGCTIYVKSDGLNIALSTMAYDKDMIDGFTGKRTANANHAYNSRLKIKPFATRLKAFCLNL